MAFPRPRARLLLTAALAGLCTVSLTGCSDEATGTDSIPTTICDPEEFSITTDAEQVADRPESFSQLGQGVRQIHEGVYMFPGFSNTFLVTTEEGSVVIDTSSFISAATHEERLRPYVVEPLRYVIVTHAHADHTAGIPNWVGEEDSGVEVLAHRSSVEFLHYQRRLDGIFRNRNSAQFSELLNLPPLPFNAPDAPVVNFGADIQGTILFDRFFEFRLGNLTFQVLHTPGETPDHISVWIPELRLAFPGDNFYLSFPNMYTLRGTRPRPALDYVAALDTVMSWNPAVLAPSHGDPVYGEDAVAARMSGYRDAIQYVHDETVRGVNAGKNIYTLMQEIALPPELETVDTNEVYGRIDWSVRGIYEGYIGWFDGNVSNISAVPPSAVHGEIVDMAGGPDTVAERAAELAADGEYERALHLADMVLTEYPAHPTALSARAESVTALREEAVNLNTRGWLTAALREIDTLFPEE